MIIKTIMIYWRFVLHVCIRIIVQNIVPTNHIWQILPNFFFFLWKREVQQPSFEYFKFSIIIDDNYVMPLSSKGILESHCFEIYLWRKVVCFDLFFSYEIHQTGMLQIVFLVSLESSRWDDKGCMGFGSMTFGLAVQKLLNIEWFFH
jgi:hypothetical protein